MLDFLITAFCIFIIVKGFERMKHKEVIATPPPAPTVTETLLAEIRDEIKKNKTV